MVYCVISTSPLAPHPSPAFEEGDTVEEGTAAASAAASERRVRCKSVIVVVAILVIFVISGFVIEASKLTKKGLAL